MGRTQAGVRRPGFALKSCVILGAHCPPWSLWEVTLGFLAGEASGCPALQGGCCPFMLGIPGWPSLAGSFPGLGILSDDPILPS